MGIIKISKITGAIVIIIAVDKRAVFTYIIIALGFLLGTEVFKPGQLTPLLIAVMPWPIVLILISGLGKERFPGPANAAAA